MVDMENFDVLLSAVDENIPGMEKGKIFPSLSA